MIAITKGAVVRYWVRESYGVSTAWTRPTTSPPISVAVSERSPPISAAASEAMRKSNESAV